MKEINELVKDIERDLLINIILSLRHKRMTKKEAKKLSASYLKGFPFRDSEDLFLSLRVLSDKFREARKVYIKYAVDYYDLKDKKILSEMRFYMNTNEIDKAIMKGGEVK